MKLDDYSMAKLWDLMTMIFKWQLAVATNINIFDISRRHLKSVAMVMPPYFPKCMIEQTMRRFESLAQKFTDDDYKSLNNTLVLWLSEYHTKISVLLRLGLQKKDGTFCLPATINSRILQGLGENIYVYDQKKNPVDEYENRCADTSEISCLLGSIDQTPAKQNKIYLPIEFGKKKAKTMIEISRDTHFKNISTNVKVRNTDLTFMPEIPKSAQEDLLEMLQSIE
ncbi:unnamed protein product [Diatraea saccharalis]|uniref:Uncharacterized protein n=1 Tax=Diatraea saccharalis TaxID=40085 RepID=A0A9N9R3H9_9NEOP|nr:unnamed protein product [Diatraea saccharalis]